MKLDATRRIRTLAVWLAAATMLTVAAPAWAGDIGRFSRDVRSSSDDDDGGRSRSSSEDEDPRLGYDYGSPNPWRDDEQMLWGQLFVNALAGHRPGSTFDWGLTPYERRGTLPMVGPPTASLGLTAEAAPRRRHAHLVLRGAANAVPGDPARGFDALIKLESTYTPGIMTWYQALWDNVDDDTLGIGVYGLEPRLWTGRSFTLHYLLGASTIHDDEGLAHVGATVGFGATVTPGARLWIDGRILGHFGVGLVDVSLRVGAETAPGVFPYIGARAIGGTAQLNIVSAGVAIDLGM